MLFNFLCVLHASMVICCYEKFYHGDTEIIESLGTRNEGRRRFISWNAKAIQFSIKSYFCTCIKQF